MENGKTIDLFKLYKIVKSFGGGDAVTSKKLWAQVARKLNVRSHNGASNIKAYYLKVIQPFVTVLESSPPPNRIHRVTRKRRKKRNVSQRCKAGEEHHDRRDE